MTSNRHIAGHKDSLKHRGRRSICYGEDVAQEAYANIELPGSPPKRTFRAENPRPFLDPRNFKPRPSSDIATASRRMLGTLHQGSDTTSLHTNFTNRLQTGLLATALCSSLPLLPDIWSEQLPSNTKSIRSETSNRDPTLTTPMKKTPSVVKSEKPRATPFPTGRVDSSDPALLPKNTSTPPPKIKLRLTLAPGDTDDSQGLGNPDRAIPSTQHNSFRPDEPMNCICSMPHTDHGAFMIACDSCGVWFHGQCVGQTPEMSHHGGEWRCPRCQS
ncbi:hypothetical protein DFS34DRAFT_444481 [Phlyctochytrium arcticum]|nr:hypothetical protein DFS34DRAFT_444481 [Phlyctochytrium arcticum]